MSLFKAENMKLKEKIEELENRLLNLVGNIKLFSSGMVNHEHEMNNHIAELLATATELRIVAPYVTKEYALLLKDRAANNVKIQLVINDRRFWPKEIANIYDELKAAKGIDLVNNPNVKYLLVWTPTQALFTSGPLDKQTLMTTVLIGTLVKEKSKIDELLAIFKEMLPTFMR